MAGTFDIIPQQFLYAKAHLFLSRDMSHNMIGDNQTNTDIWIYQSQGCVPGRSKHPLSTGYTAVSPGQVNGTVGSQNHYVMNDLTIDMID
jgi:hypothetical protein